MAKKRLVVTGASGYISAQLLPAFRQRYDLVLLDVAAGDGIDAVDLTDPDIDAYRRHFADADAIVHNAWINRPETPSTAPVQWLDDRPPGNPDGYYQERDNLDMAFHVFKLALEENVRRVVVTSSNHAADWYETKLHNGKLDTIGPDIFPLSDNFYGWAKATYEHLGFLFATGRLGGVVENVQIRIGAPRPVLGRDFDGDEVSHKRDLGAYISPRDMAQLYMKSIETGNIRNEDGIPFQIFYGVSNNTRAYWSIANARRVIGYEPEDDSEREFAENISAHIKTNGRTL